MSNRMGDFQLLVLMPNRYLLIMFLYFYTEFPGEFFSKNRIKTIAITALSFYLKRLLIPLVY